MSNNEEREYLLAAEAAQICRFKTSHPIRRAVARGDLPGIRVQQNRLLIPAKAFWEWFHRKDVVPKQPRPIALKPEVVFVPADGKKKAHFKIAKKAVV